MRLKYRAIVLLTMCLLAGCLAGLGCAEAPAELSSYRTVEVRYRSCVDGAVFAGTLTIPNGDSAVPAVLLLSGAGFQDRDESVYGHKPFRALAEHLTSQGIAVLRVDDRGVGESTGGVVGATPETFARDALAGVSHLRSRSDMHLSMVGLLGHSEGAHVATIAASSSGDVDFVIMLGGLGLPWPENNQLAQAEMLRRLGKSASVISAALALNERLYQVVREGHDVQATEELLRETIAAWRASLQGEAKREFDGFTREHPDHWDWLADQFAEPPYRYHITTDPRRVIKKLECPVLALCGEKDVQVLPGPNLEAIERTLEESGHNDHEVMELPGLNHLFQECETGLMSEYEAIDQAFSPGAMSLISEWILGRYVAKGDTGNE